MANKFIDTTGLSHLWEKIKGTFVAKDGSKVLSDNNFTNVLKNKLDGIEAQANKYTLPAASESVLGGIKVGSNLFMDENNALNATGEYTGTYVVELEWRHIISDSPEDKYFWDVAAMRAIETHYENNELCILRVKETFELPGVLDELDEGEISDMYFNHTAQFGRYIFSNVYVDGDSSVETHYARYNEYDVDVRSGTIKRIKSSIDMTSYSEEALVRSTT